MKRMVLITSLLLGASSVAQATTLAEHLPAGALLTLESRNAGGAIDRLMGVVSRVMTAFMSKEEQGDMQELKDMQAMLKASLGREATLGVFTVSGAGGKFSPEVLAVTRAEGAALKEFTKDFPRKPGAKVGVYSFVRSGNEFVGQGGGLVFMSTNKDLLMAYLGRLSGRTAPRLLNSAAYTTPTRGMGQQELSVFLNFSAAAKVARSYLAGMLLPRLLSPVVDAVDTLGQFAGGFTTTPAGLTGQGAHLPNPQGKDRPLLNMLTHRTDFKVQNIIPAQVQQVQASACHPDSGPYLGRWLTRFDLFEPFGFLTDSQLASHLERSARYLGDECAQVTLAGSMQAGLDPQDPLASLKYSVSYQRVRDMAAAEAHMPEYAESVNNAIQGALDAMQPLLKEGGLDTVTGALPRDMQGSAALAGAGLMGGLGDLIKAARQVKMVYAFRDDYLIVAFSDTALNAALAENPDTLAENDEFKAANLNMNGTAGWTYQPNLPDLSVQDFMGLLPSTEDEQDEDTQAMMQEIFGTIYGPVVDIFNRYDGMTGQRDVITTPQGNLVISKTNVKYRW